MRMNGRLVFGNSFSINMFQDIQDVVVRFKKVSVDEVKEIVEMFSNEFLSVIGHEDWSKIVSDDLGIDIPMNKQTYTMESNDTLIVCQRRGNRLENGVIQLTDENRGVVEYWKVEIVVSKWYLLLTILYFKRNW